MAVPSVEAHLPIAPGAQTVPVVLDLVQPVLPSTRAAGPGNELRGNPMLVHGMEYTEAKRMVRCDVASAHRPPLTHAGGGQADDWLARCPAHFPRNFPQNFRGCASAARSRPRSQGTPTWGGWSTADPRVSATGLPLIQSGHCQCGERRKRAVPQWPPECYAGTMPPGTPPWPRNDGTRPRTAQEGS
jgi:hypothetical protein